MVVCARCGAGVDCSPGRGRPRKFCAECSPKRGGYEPVMLAERACACGTRFTPKTATHRHCSAECRHRARDYAKKKLPCDLCGRAVWLGRSSAAVPRCRECRSPQHGDVAMYKKRGCRCAECRAAVARHHRERRVRAKAAGKPVRRGGSWISRRDRSYIYMRDNFCCQLCGARVTLEADYMDALAPTIDHIVPKALGGGDEIENLRLACRQCNSSRGARVDWSPDGVPAGDAQVAG